jgi:hypothetical protein
MILYISQAERAFGLCAPTTLPFVGVSVNGGIACLLVNVGKFTVAWTGYDIEAPVQISEAA